MLSEKEYNHIKYALDNFVLHNDDKKKISDNIFLCPLSQNDLKPHSKYSYFCVFQSRLTRFLIYQKHFLI